MASGRYVVDLEIEFLDVIFDGPVVVDPPFRDVEGEGITGLFVRFVHPDVDDRPVDDGCAPLPVLVVDDHVPVFAVGLVVLLLPDGPWCNVILGGDLLDHDDIPGIDDPESARIRAMLHAPGFHHHHRRPGPGISIDGGNNDEDHDDRHQDIMNDGIMSILTLGGHVCVIEPPQGTSALPIPVVLFVH